MKYLSETFLFPFTSAILFPTIIGGTLRTLTTAYAHFPAFPERRKNRKKVLSDDNLRYVPYRERKPESL